MEISGYNLVRSDHSLKSKPGGVCIYYKNYLLLRIISINYLSECINFEIMIGNKICNFITLYRSPSQNQDDFQAFIDNLEMNLETLAQRNLFLMVVTGVLTQNLNIGAAKTVLISLLFLLKMWRLSLV